MAKSSGKTRTDHAYHVDRNEASDRWDVVDQDGKVIGNRHDRGEAIEFAIHQAQNIHDENDIVVCVEQSSGHYTLAWSSR
jgi:hypothetical protein